MHFVDLEMYKTYCSNEKLKMNQLMNSTNREIDGRVCASSWLHYVMCLFNLVKDDVKVYAEIGSLWGGSAAMILQLANKGTEVFCIDLFNGYYNKPTKANDWNKCSINVDGTNHLDFVKRNLEKFNKNNNEVHYLKGSSYDDETVSKFNSYQKKVDFFFIDGDHSEAGVVKDFLRYKDYIQHNGIICFDNYGGSAWPGVKRGLDKVDFKSYGYNIIGVFSERPSSEGCLIIQKMD